jgi:hypothetical protein
MVPAGAPRAGHEATIGVAGASCSVCPCQPREPDAVMKKAIPEGMAPFTPRTLSGLLREALPASEGFAFNWGPYFYGGHNRIPEGTDGGTGRHAEHTDSSEFFKALPPGPGGSPSAPTARARQSDDAIRHAHQKRKACCWTGLNCRPLPYQGSALPLSCSSAATVWPALPGHHTHAGRRIIIGDGRPSLHASRARGRMPSFPHLAI